MLSSFKTFIISLFYTEEIVPIEIKKIIPGKSSIVTGFKPNIYHVLKSTLITKYRTEPFTTYSRGLPVYNTRTISCSTHEMRFVPETSLMAEYKDIDVSNIQVISGKTNYEICTGTSDADKLYNLFNELDGKIVLKRFMGYSYITNKNGGNLQVLVKGSVSNDEITYNLFKEAAGFSVMILLVVVTVHAYYCIKKLTFHNE
jgi:hypothetical protein